MKTYIFKVELEEEEGIWQVVVPALPRCKAWGKTQEEALAAIQENTKAYIETLVEAYKPIPVEKRPLDFQLTARYPFENLADPEIRAKFDKELLDLKCLELYSYLCMSRQKDT